MAKSVNLDALIPRDDFLATEGSVAGESGKQSASQTDLKKGESFYLTLRKPDFQRETSAWSPNAVCDFIKAFIDGDLIPSVICWQSESRLSFIIDGAHRLSAIIAWLNDDYGDGDDSIKFYDNRIPEEQRKIAQKTRDLINSEIGSFKDFTAEMKNPNSNPRLTARVRALGHSTIPLLWVKSGDSKKAESAFLTINQSAVEIDPTELKILKDRKKPNAIAARAIVRNATGHIYWKDFSDTSRTEIESSAKSIYSSLYNPPLKSPIRNDDLPIAGFGYGSQTLPLVFDFVNIANNIPVVDSSKGNRKAVVSADNAPLDEQATVEAVRLTNKLIRRITGTNPSSLGLHPAVYFYSANGRHQPTTVLAMALLVREMEVSNEFANFTSVRNLFEEFMIEHKMFVNQLTVRHGSMVKGFRQIKDYFEFVLKAFTAGKSTQDILSELHQHDKYQILIKERPTPTVKSKEFSGKLINLKFLSDSLSKAFRCGVCGARIDNKSMNLDHVQDKSAGGIGSSENAQWTHPYCNSTHKQHTSRSKTQ